MKRFALIHPFLFTTVSVLFAYIRFIVDIPPWEIIRPLLFLYALVALLVYPAYKIMGEWEAAGILLSTFVLGFFFSEQAFYFVGVSLFLVIFIWMLYTYLRKRKNDLKQIIILLNLTGIILILVLPIRILSLIAPIPLKDLKNAFDGSPQEIFVELEKTEPSPDIYYIILDGYLRADLVERFYNYDNSEFVEALEKRGFIIPGNNHSNYPRTAYSVTSTLNLNYVDEISPETNGLTFSWVALSPFLRNNQVKSALSGLGYETVSTQSVYSVGDNRNVDRYYQLHQVKLNGFEDIFINNTALSLFEPLLREKVYFRSFKNHRDLILFAFDTLSEIPNLSGSQYVYAHITTPHPPFVFGKDGSFQHFDTPFILLDGNDYLGTPEEYQNGYAQQMGFINMKIIELVDEILMNSDSPPLIVIQADHGSGMLTDFNNIENTCLEERFSPFAAYYLPGMNEEKIPPDITPVNLFRIIFNEYFGAELPLLENRYYYYDAYYEITLEQIEGACEK